MENICFTNEEMRMEVLVTLNCKLNSASFVLLLISVSINRGYLYITLYSYFNSKWQRYSRDFRPEATVRLLLPRKEKHQPVIWLELHFPTFADTAI